MDILYSEWYKGHSSKTFDQKQTFLTPRPPKFICLENTPPSTDCIAYKTSEMQDQGLADLAFGMFCTYFFPMKLFYSLCSASYPTEVDILFISDSLLPRTHCFTPPLLMTGRLWWMAPNPSDRFLVFVSGLEIGPAEGREKEDPLAIQLLVDLLSGQVGDEATQERMSKVV